MALSKPLHGTGWHFWMRLAGLTGLLLLVVGLVVWAEAGALGLVIVLAAAGLVALAVVAELRGALDLVSSRRGAFGSNVVLQILLALVLLVGVNAFSFFHHARLDWTRDSIFTIDAKIEPQLRQLRGETTIVVYQRHSTSGPTADREADQDYDVAAERKIVEKVKDLVEQFQELGPRFRVELLDVQEKGFRKKMEALKGRSAALAEAIERAPENSIFFYAKHGNDEQIQRLSFHDVYQLDKKTSKEANGGRGNLVLYSQGVGPFARKVLNIQEKRPRIGVAVVHEWLSMDAPPPEDTGVDFGMSGAGKVLAAQGFDSRDIILKKWSEMGPPEPVVLTQQESEYERLEEEVAEVDATIKDIEAELKETTEAQAFWKNSSLKDINKKYVIALHPIQGPRLLERTTLDKLQKSGQKIRTFEVEEEHRQDILKGLEPERTVLDLNLRSQQQERDGLVGKQRKLNVEELAEKRRISDLKAKMSRELADCDLLIIPRRTLMNVAKRQAIPNRVHKLDDGQFAAVRDFLKAGKPVLFCLGPSNELPERALDPENLGPDRLEETVEELGIKLPRETVLFTVERKSFAEQRSGLIFPGAAVEVPPVEFEWQPGAGYPGTLSSARRLPPHPIRSSLRVTTRGWGTDQALDLRLRHPRPVYYEPSGNGKPATEAILMMTNADAWNEDQPFPTRERTPRFEKPKDDPKKGTVEEKRKGQFPIGVAVETQLPASWYSGEEKARPATVRLAVLGHGAVFSGINLSPVREKLLLDTCNWLLGRDDLLAQDNVTWEYPRVNLSDTSLSLWQWGTRLGLPLLFVYLGMVVLMVRRMR
jgi:hypothetical protein